MTSDISLLKADKIVDARGMSCPGPLLAAKKAMTEVKPGQVLEVKSSDAGTLRDLPLWANKMGYAFLGILEESGYTRIFVRKGK